MTYTNLLYPFPLESLGHFTANLAVCEIFYKSKVIRINANRFPLSLWHVGLHSVSMNLYNLYTSHGPRRGPNSAWNYM